MDIDLKRLVEDLIAVFKMHSNKTWTSVKSSAEKYSIDLAEQTNMILRSRIAGSLRYNEDQFNKRMKEVKDQAKNYAQLLVARTVKAIEELWNALVAVLWDAVNKALDKAGLSFLKVPVG